ncbi:DUF2878 domain-containing protein [Shewanella sedimentimangrovi]|uniref:DUF2878 domain-containing protein n=1 Tax=Shewanella sedimentimangrovi TaxID=2814293 RepID=A0ABX7QYR6_9GAMM|nr:DUF2878 domain-containing protein [Shewanella sedimentimangrovi]QSX36678.1 DUF2878 domain-containing protein [Shewanella sedimentimangrovi]
MRRQTAWRWGQLLGFDIYWTLAVVLRSPWPLLPMLALHLWLTPSRQRDLWLLPLAAGGFSIDLLLWGQGVLAFNAFPLWLLGLWVGFVWTLPHGMGWLEQWSPLWVALLGAIVGPLAYLVGAKFGGVALPFGAPWSAVVLALIWAVLLPVLVAIVKQRSRPPASASHAAPHAKERK